MKLETTVGWVDDSKLSVQELVTETPAGRLSTKNYFFGEELVKVDQQLDISAEALEAAGISQL